MQAATLASLRITPILLEVPESLFGVRLDPTQYAGPFTCPLSVVPTRVVRGRPGNTFDFT